MWFRSCTLGVSFETFDVLSDMEIRQGIKEFSKLADDPPGLCERGIHRRFRILIEMYNAGELKEKLEIALAS